MAYSELIKNFSCSRDYMRQFYIYGFKSREEYDRKSARSYDDERRRIESWLGDYMRFRQTPDGKNVFLSIDSRVSRHNPLYAGWKTKSFTDGDITLHFILFDILCSPEIVLSLSEITERIDEYLHTFETPRLFDESTVRKKLKEYISEGLILSEKHGRTIYYHRAEMTVSLDTDVLDYFSEVAPCGVIGSYLLDKTGAHEGRVAFKHHYITSAMDSEILYTLLLAIREKRFISIETVNKRKEHLTEAHIIPLRVMVSAQSGRQFLMAYAHRFRRITSFRIDNILSVETEDVCPYFERYRKELDAMRPNMWGISVKSRSPYRLEHVEFTVTYGDDEAHIHNRLEREKRCGTVERLDDHTSRFSADVFDSTELVPWIRTFICRITEISFSNKALDQRFRDDIQAMYRLYDTEGGEG